MFAASLSLTCRLVADDEILRECPEVPNDLRADLQARSELQPYIDREV